MPSFDVVSEVDMQEVRNAVDQAAREVSQRFDFKNTNSSVELGDDEIKLASVSEDRLTALRQVLEEKLVKRKVSTKVLDYGTIEQASAPCFFLRFRRARGHDVARPEPRTIIFFFASFPGPRLHPFHLAVQSVCLFLVIGSPNPLCQ